MKAHAALLSMILVGMLGGVQGGCSTGVFLNGLSVAEVKTFPTLPASLTVGGSHSPLTMVPDFLHNHPQSKYYDFAQDLGTPGVPTSGIFGQDTCTGDTIELDCYCHPKKCVFYIVTYHCPGCSGDINGGFDGLVNNGWEVRSCGPKFQNSGASHPMLVYHKTFSGTEVVCPAKVGKYVGVFSKLLNSGETGTVCDAKQIVVGGGGGGGGKRGPSGPHQESTCSKNCADATQLPLPPTPSMSFP